MGLLTPWPNTIAHMFPISRHPATDEDSCQSAKVPVQAGLTTFVQCSIRPQSERGRAGARCANRCRFVTVPDVAADGGRAVRSWTGRGREGLRRTALRAPVHLCAPTPQVSHAHPRSTTRSSSE
ncbi:hypothetical protein STRAU_3954 [Streptomyces aurantiacus JA 4570]|uniref:Uncharacterized protein n=1 Tax=Streptomyces aurantiacus JA 4570 TaxID=1286094 RepID=S3ZX05_9ACTN|nr:hypothetical protein STRAU_3954 [Streptomyces aurantiacus JA 4570]